MTLEASPYKQITTEYYQSFKKWLSESGNISDCPDAVGFLYGMNRFILKRIGPYNLLQIIDSHRFDLLFQTRHHWEYLKRYHNAETRNLVTKLCFDYCKQPFEEYLDYEASRVFATQADPNTLYIHKGNIACLRFRHKTNDITVSLATNSNQRIKATATHCWKCNIIFMPKRQYLLLRIEHRFLVANFCEIGDDGYTPVKDVKMKEESMEPWMVILGIVALVVGIMVARYIANCFYEIACMKGFHDRCYFWIPFLLGIVGYLLVVALPDRKQEKATPAKPTKPLFSPQGTQKPVGRWACPDCGNSHPGEIEQCECGYKR